MRSRNQVTGPWDRRRLGLQVNRCSKLNSLRDSVLVSRGSATRGEARRGQRTTAFQPVSVIWAPVPFTELPPRRPQLARPDRDWLALQRAAWMATWQPACTASGSRNEEDTMLQRSPMYA